MSFALPSQLGGSLEEREAITDSLHRAVLAWDLGDEELLRSTSTEDFVFELMGRTPMRGFTELQPLFDHVGGQLDTVHLLSNVRVHVEVPGVAAKATCAFIAQHALKGKGREPGPNRFTTGGMYLCELVKEGELWKFKDWKINVVWSDGDRDVMTAQ